MPRTLGRACLSEIKLAQKSSCRFADQPLLVPILFWKISGCIEFKTRAGRIVAMLIHLTDKFTNRKYNGSVCDSRYSGCLAVPPDGVVEAVRNYTMNRHVPVCGRNRSEERRVGKD